MAIKIKPADKAFSDVVHAAYNHTCARCGRVGRVENSHIHTRAHRTIRWCKENGVAKCHTCHRWWHGNPTEAGVWFIATFGQGVEDLLIEKRNQKVKIPKAEEKEIAKHYREQLKIIQEKRANGEEGFIDYISWQ